MQFLDAAQRRSLIETTAGLGAGAISTVLFYPLDLVKVHYQVHERSPHAYRSLTQAFTTIYKTGGVPGLFRGMSPAIYGATIAWGLYMVFYANAKDRYARWAKEGWIHGNTIQYFLASMEAGIVTVPIMNPIWVIKVRMQVQSRAMIERASLGHGAAAKFANIVPYRSVTDGFKRIVLEEGVPALFKGMVPAVILTSHAGIKFVCYETMKHVYLAKSPSNKMSVAPTLIMGAISQGIASSAMYPYQLIKARLQQGGPNAAHYKGTWDCTVKIMRHEGPGGFFKGLYPNLLKVIPTGAVVFASYEQIRSIMSRFLLDD